MKPPPAQAATAQRSSGPVTVEGRRLTDRLIRRGLRINILAGAIGMPWVAVALGMPLTMLLEALGASGFQLGLVVTLQQLAMLIQIPSAIVAERLDARKTYWAGLALTHRLLWFFPATLPLLLANRPQIVIWCILAVVGLSAALAQAATAPWFSWMADLVPTRIGGSFWGRRQTIVMSIFLVSMGVAGWALDRWSPEMPEGQSMLGFNLVFSFAAALGMADIIVHLAVPEPRPRPARRKLSLRIRLFAPWRRADFRWATLAIGMWYFAIGVVGSFSAVYLRREFGATYSQLSAITISASLGTILAGLPMGYLIDRLGARAMAAILFVAAPMLGGFWFFVSPHPVDVSLPLLGAMSVPQPIAIFTFANILGGALYSGLGLCQINLVSALAPRQGRTMAMAFHWSMVGLLAASGPLFAGWVMDSVTANPLPWHLPSGARVSFFHVLVLIHVTVGWFLCLPLLLRCRLRRHDKPVGAALGLLRVGSPLRAISNVYSIYQMGGSASSEQRAKAAKTLGESKAAVAVTDLIEKLDDPSADVREEAVMALGRIGSDDAIAALVAKLDDPESDLAAQIARALREAKASESVDPLVKRLADDADRETQRETARTLGEIGDRRASESLLDLIRRTDDPQVLTASGTALAKLGELAAIYEIMPHLQATRNPVLKQSLAVAVGDLLAPRASFYKLLTNELRAAGSEVDKLLRDLRRRLRRQRGNAATDAAFDASIDTLLSLIDELLEAYEHETWPRAIELTFELALGLSALLYRLDQGNDQALPIEQLVWHDNAYALGLWFLEMRRRNALDETLPDPDRVDTLLGIHFLGELGDRLKSGTRPDASTKPVDDANSQGE